MARYRATSEIQQPRDEVFAYRSDFSTTEQWDPSVVEAQRVNDRAVAGLRRTLAPAQPRPGPGERHPQT